MHVIQILLPLLDNADRAFPKEYYIELTTLLTEQFGGITAYTRSPARGFWKENDRETVKDDIVIFEVMAEGLDGDWWRACRADLKKIFAQDEIIIRSWKMELL